jgi:hypothetical protein
MWESAPPSPSPGFSPTFDSSAPPVLPIQIPQTGDAATQQFFEQLVGQIQTLSLRNSLPPSPASSPTPIFVDAYGQRVEQLDDRFEDAEDDETELASMMNSPYMSEYQDSSRNSTIQPLLLNKAPPLVRPRLNLPPGARGSSRSESPILVGRANSRTGQYRTSQEQRDKENVRYSRQGATSPSPNMGARMMADKRATLGLAIQNDWGNSMHFDFDAVMVGTDIPGVDNGTPGIGLGSRLHRKKKRESHRVRRRDHIY